MHTVNDFTFAGSSGTLVVTLPVKVKDTLEHHVYAKFDWPGKGNSPTTMISTARSPARSRRPRLA